MALQGTIETFALPDVLRLLASTKKSGELELRGDRGTGRLWVADGAIVKSEAEGAPHAKGAVDVVFELLRFHEGEFVFSDGSPGEAGSPEDVESVLGEAEKLLAEWREIEAVVPSGTAWVSLAPELPGETVTIDRERWGAIVAVGSGSTVDQLGGKLELGELPVARLVKGLVEADLVQVGEAPAGAATDSGGGISFEAPVTPVAPSPEPEPAQAVPDPEPVSEPEREPEPFDPNALVIEEVTPEPEPGALGGLEEALPEASPSDAAEIARQLANLSPKAARAVAAAAKATTAEERDAALAEVEETDDQINRDLLLKFLGTVN